MDDIIREAEMQLFYAQLDREVSEPKHIAFMAKIYGISPEELYRQRMEGPTLEEQRGYDKAARAIAANTQ